MSTPSLTGGINQETHVVQALVTHWHLFFKAQFKPASAQGRQHMAYPAISSLDKFSALPAVATLYSNTVQHKGLNTSNTQAHSSQTTVHGSDSPTAICATMRPFWWGAFAGVWGLFPPVNTSQE